MREKRKRDREEKEEGRKSVHVLEEISTAVAALKILGNDVVVRSGINLAALAFEDLRTIQRLYEQATHQILHSLSPCNSNQTHRKCPNWDLGIRGFGDVPLSSILIATGVTETMLTD